MKKFRPLTTSTLILWLLALSFFIVAITSPALAKRHKKNKHKRQLVPYKGYVVMEAITGAIIKADHPDVKVEPASVSKLMLVAIIFDFIEQGKAKLNEIVTTSRKAAKMGGSQVFLKQGEQFPLEELIYAILIQSANDACVAVAEHLAGS